MIFTSINDSIYLNLTLFLVFFVSINFGILPLPKEFHLAYLCLRISTTQ